MGPAPAPYRYLSSTPPHSASSYTPSSARFALTPRPGTQAALQSILEDTASPVSDVFVESLPVLPYMTARAATLGAILCTLASVLSTVLHFKLAAPPLSPLLAALVAVPVGKQLAKREWGGQDPWALQEAVIISSMAGAGAIYPYAADIVVELTVLYQKPTSMPSSVVLLLTSQLVGLCLAGPLDHVLVRPSNLIWPTNLPLISLLNTLHTPVTSNQSRHINIFLTAAVGMFVYQFLPTVFFPLLASVSIICLGTTTLSPSSLTTQIATALGSSHRGFGVASFSLDWSTISLAGPLYVPLAPALSMFAGIAIWIWFMNPILWSINFWNSMEFPNAVGGGLFDRNMQPLNIGDIINTADLSLNETAFENHQPILLNPNFALSYAWGFAALASAVVSVSIWQGPDIIRALFQAFNRESERVERKHDLRRTIPRNWNLCIFAICLLMTGSLNLFVPIHIPLGAVFAAVGLGAAFVIPCGVIAGLSGTIISLNIISELICGFLHPGHAAGNMVFKTLCQATMTQALRMCADLKLCAHTKTPARSVFAARVIGAFINTIVTCITISYVLSKERADLEATEERTQWSGRQSRLFGAASVTFGLLGPARFFSGNYVKLYWGFVVGALAPILGWAASKVWPRAGWEKVCWPLVALGAGSVPEWPSNLFMGLVATLFAQWWAPRYAARWYKESRLVMSAALDAGTALSALSAVLFNVASIAPIWWGNPPGDAERCSS